MKVKKKKLTMLSVLSALLALSLFPQLLMQGYAQEANTEEGKWIEVTDEFAIWRRDEPQQFLVYDEGVVNNQAGFSYDKATNTLTIENVNDLVYHCYDVQAYDMETLTVQVKGTNKVARFSAAGNTSFDFQGTGSLELSPFQKFYPNPKDQSKEPENQGHFMGYGLTVDGGTVHVGKTVKLILNGTDYGDEYDGCATLCAGEKLSAAQLMQKYFTYDGTISVAPTVKVDETPAYEEERPVTDDTCYISYRFPAVVQPHESLEYGYSVSETTGTIFRKKDTGDYYVWSMLQDNQPYTYNVARLIYDEELGAWREKIEKDPQNPGEYLDVYNLYDDDTKAQFEEILDVSQLPDNMVDGEGMINAYLHNSHDIDYGVYLKDGKRYTLAMGFYYNLSLYPEKPAHPKNWYYQPAFGNHYANGAAIFQLCEKNGLKYLEYVEEIEISYMDYNYQSAWIEALENAMKNRGYEKQFETVQIPAIYTHYLTNKKLTFSPVRKSITPTVKLSKTSYVYNGKVQKPTVTVYDGKTKLDAANYTVSYAKGRKAAGTYKVTVTMKGSYSGTGTASFKITKAPQPMKVATKAKTVKYKKVKKSAQTVTGAITVTKPQGTVSYTKVTKGSDKNLTINKKNGKITVKKGTKKGKHKLVVKVKAAGNANYKAGTKTVTVTIVVK